MIIDVRAINKELKRKKKAIAVYGCSWAAGQGAYDPEFDIYPTKMKNARRLFALSDDVLEKAKGNWRHFKNGYYFEESFVQENDNSFVSILTKEYLNNDYVPLNFGLPGCGNAASVRYADIIGIDWETIETLDIIFMPTDVSRGYYPTVDESNKFCHWTLWPHIPTEPDNVARAYHNISVEYSRSYIEKRAIIDFFFHTRHLQWISKNFKNSKFMILPAFSPSFTQEYFRKTLGMVYDHLEKRIKGKKSKYLHMVNQYPWDCFVTPNGAANYAEFILQQEPEEWTPFSFLDIVDKGTPNGFLTICAHPSKKGHKLLAEWFYNNEYK